MGCVLFVVKPPTTGGDYVVTILGNTGGQAYVNLSSEVTETKTEYSVQPQQVRTIRFENYDQAASVTANVTLGGGGTADSVTLTPLGGTAGPVTATVVGGVANFDAVYPTTYSVETQPTPCLPNSITVAPGENQTIDVVIP
jgi:hypothetical protein